MRDGTLHLWCHSQGIYPLRASIARSIHVFGASPIPLSCAVAGDDEIETLASNPKTKIW